MPVISHRGAQMPPSPIRKLVPYADAAKKRGTKVYHLNIGQPDIETPKAILDAVRHTDMKVLEYSPSPGFESYRKKLVAYYQRNNIDVTSNQIIIAIDSGCVALSLASRNVIPFGSIVVAIVFVLFCIKTSSTDFVLAELEKYE